MAICPPPVNPSMPTTERAGVPCGKECTRGRKDQGKIRFQSFKVSKFQSFKVSRFQGFKVESKDNSNDKSKSPTQANGRLEWGILELLVSNFKTLKL
jgi:hypothetical protein